MSSLERERLEAEIRLKEGWLALAQERFNASQKKPASSWRATFGKALAGMFPLLVALAAPTVGLIQFGLSQEHAARLAAAARISEAESRAATARLEARKAFTAKKLQLYEKTVSVTGRLASDPMDSPEFRQARREFERLYWAELPLVEEPKVSEAMVKLRSALYPPNADDINQFAIDLARAVRADLREAYGGDGPAALISPSAEGTLDEAAPSATQRD